MIIKANCKINIGLNVVRKREDGFHELETAMYPVSGLYDIIEADTLKEDAVSFTAKGIMMDCDAESNICTKAYRLMRERYAIGGIAVTLDKRIPFGAGLGGGSADGTAVIMAVNELYSLSLTEDTLMSLAATLGSDTAFFIRNTPQLCTGRGEIMTPADISLDGMTLVIAKPDENVSTREAYAGIRPSVPQYRLSELLKMPVAEWRDKVKNDFEPHIFAAHPRIAMLKNAMYGQGAVYAAMSGSGSAVFGLFDGDTQFIPPFENVFVHKERL